MTYDFENLFLTFWQFGKDYVGLVMALVFVFVIVIMIYEWFRFKP